MLPNPSFFGYQFDWFSSLANVAIVFTAFIMLIRYKQWKSFGLFPALLFFAGLFIIGSFGSKSFEAIEAILTNDAAIKQFSFWKMLTGEQGGKRWFGAVFASFFVIYLFIRITKKNEVLALLDEFLIAVSGGVVIGKMGCFLSGHGCYGVPSNLPWAMRVPHGSFPSILPVHPTALYDAIVYATLFIFLWKLSKHKKHNGQPTIIFLFVICICSILIEILRINEAVILSMSMAQIIYLLLLVGTIVFYFQRPKQEVHKFKDQTKN